MQTAGWRGFSDLFNWKDCNPPLQGGSFTPEAHLAAPTAEPSWDPSEGRRPLLEHCLLVHLGRALKTGTKAKGFEQNSRNSAKQMKNSRNF